MNPDDVPTRRILRTFLASPGDVADEREIVDRVVTELNIVWSEFLGIQLELLRWETHAFPGVSTYAQAVINGQISNYQIFLGIFWSRLGTPPHLQVRERRRSSIAPSTFIRQPTAALR